MLHPLIYSVHWWVFHLCYIFMLCIRHLEKKQFIIYSDIPDVDTAHYTIFQKPGLCSYHPWFEHRYPLVLGRYQPQCAKYKLLKTIDSSWKLVLHLLKQRFFLKWQMHFFHSQDNVHQEPIENNQNFICLFLFQIKMMSSEQVATLSHNLKVTSLLRVSFFTSDKSIVSCVF